MTHKKVLTAFHLLRIAEKQLALSAIESSWGIKEG